MAPCLDCGPRRIILWALLLLAPAVSQGQSPAVRVQFDAPYLVAVRELATSAGLQAGEKLVECRLEVSALVTAGNERDVSQFTFQLQSLQRTMQVHDYLPRSVRDTNITGQVTVSEGVEDASSAGLNLTGKYQDWSTLSANVGETHKLNGSREFERLPALETVVASGTTYRGTGVYFKLHTTDRQLLEGATTLNVLWHVPSGWRGDYVHLQCIAEGRTRDQGGQRLGQRDFLIPLHLAGDAPAKRVAAEFARTEASVRMVARQELQQHSSRPSSPWPPKVNLFSNNREPSLPHDWLERLLYLPSNPQLPAALSPETRAAAGEFLAARQRLRRLSGWAVPATDEISTR